MSVRATYKLRTTKSTHERLYRLAKRTEKSISQLVVILLDSGMSSERSSELKNLSLQKEDPEARPVPFSGTWIQNMPVLLHDQIFAMAKEEGVSINLLLNNLLCRELGWVERNLGINC